MGSFHLLFSYWMSCISQLQLWFNSIALKTLQGQAFLVMLLGGIMGVLQGQMEQHHLWSGSTAHLAPGWHSGSVLPLEC